MPCICPQCSKEIGDSSVVSRYAVPAKKKKRKKKKTELGVYFVTHHFTQQKENKEYIL
jgi:hypothetical protein